MTEINIKGIREQFKKMILMEWPKTKWVSTYWRFSKQEEKKKPVRNWAGKIVRKWKRMVTLLMCLIQTGN